MTGLLIVSIIVLAITLVTITKHKRFLESYYQELLQTLQDSQVVKSDLEKLMNQAVQLSSEMVSRLEQSVIEAKQPMPEDNRNDQLGGAEETGFYLHNDHPVFMETSDPNGLQNQDSNMELPMLYHQVVSLYQQGYSIKDIASRLNRGQGEVSLILSITSKRRAI